MTSKLLQGRTPQPALTLSCLVGTHMLNDQQQLHMQELTTPHGSLYSCS